MTPGSALIGWRSLYYPMHASFFAISRLLSPDLQRPSWLVVVDLRARRWKPVHLLVPSTGCPQTLLLMRWCGGHQRTLSSSRHRENRCRWNSGNISSKPKEKPKRKTECPSQKLNETDKGQDCQEGCHVETSLPHGLCSTLRSEYMYTWHGGHKLEREARRDRRLLWWDSCVERESWSAADRCPEQSTMRRLVGMLGC